jgi:hypothetical protein
MGELRNCRKFYMSTEKPRINPDKLLPPRKGDGEDYGEGGRTTVVPIQEPGEGEQGRRVTVVPPEKPHIRKK